MILSRPVDQYRKISPRSHELAARDDDVFAGVLFLVEGQVAFPILVSLHRFILGPASKTSKRFLGWSNFSGCGSVARRCPPCKVDVTKNVTK
jgi:hypothetical protein